VDVYEWMRAVTRKAGFAEPVERDALDLVNQLEARSVFGTMAAATDVTEHAPDYPFMSRVCSTCHKEHDE
jgi:hypothetical protein